MNVQWYPGHMAKAKRIIKESISMVDIIIEILDARVPYSSKNPDIDDLAKNKFRIIVLNKYDLANKDLSEKWKQYFESKNYNVVFTNSIDGNGINKIIDISRILMNKKIINFKKRGRIFTPIRAIVVGIPNVGKSTLINKCVGKTIAKAENKAGITKGNQWIKIKKDIELLDTPGILWPKFEDKNIGINLAIIGSINYSILDIYTLSINLIDILKNYDCLQKRYKIKFNIEESSEEILTKIGQSRGFKLKGNIIDLERTSNVVINEFKECKLGRITLEKPF